MSAVFCDQELQQCEDKRQATFHYKIVKKKTDGVDKIRTMLVESAAAGNRQGGLHRAVPVFIVWLTLSLYLSASVFINQQTTQ